MITPERILYLSFEQSEEKIKDIIKTIYSNSDQKFDILYENQEKRIWPGFIRIQDLVTAERIFTKSEETKGHPPRIEECPF